ncbi:MAG: acyl-CoA thioester hydrolase [Clostridiales bacterium]|nr:acyl-CoA thioester hydrolase [Clostridiales bacterium]MDD7309241.1 acyl-CoA thioester hydrolase/BAAT C-terminal domain-containing protein [Eubacteriales bacterium]MDY5346301.1 acyl-CoA thioester hydrolase/BAAT C-terminal domain-containing protein [Eubacteriales bacterium]
MKHISFEVDADGFHGAYWPCRGGSACAVIAMLGDDAADYMARSAVKWLMKLGVNVMTMSPGKKDYGHHNYPLERIETAIAWLKAHGNQKIGIAGASTTGTLALTAAAMFPEISLTIAMTPSDFVWQGFMQGKKDGCKEWPIAGESLFSYHGKPLPYMPFCYQHPQYWQVIAEETRQSGDMLASRKLFDDSEAAHPITEDAYIKVENIRGRLLLIGAADDSLWDTAKYIRRMERRLAEKPHDCTVETAVYAHGTHFVFPEGMLKTILPIGSGLFMKLAFRAAKQFPEACRQTRMDIDRRITAAIQAWRTAQ